MNAQPEIIISGQDEELLKTIHIPKNLNLIGQMLPKSKYDSQLCQSNEKGLSSTKKVRQQESLDKNSTDMFLPPIREIESA